MQRQRIRTGALIVSAMLFPVTFYYLSPFLILMGLAEGIVAGSFVVFGGLFFSALFFGRAFCGWVCPAGAIGESVGLVRDKRVKRTCIRSLRNWIWLIWLVLVVASAVQGGGLRRVEFTYQTWHGISVGSWPALIILAIVLALVVGLSLLLGRRGFCYSACWMAPFTILGRMLRDRLRLPGLRLTAERTKCVSCGACTAACPMSLTVEKMVAREDMTATECVLCARCVDTCSKGAIRLRFARHASSDK